MRIARTFGGIIMLLLAAAACGQETRLVVSGAPLQNSAQTADRVPEVPPGDIVREIDAPHTGDRWLLIRDARHPGGPGLLLLVSFVRVESRQTKSELKMPAPIIRAGDRVIVEESTPVMEARLEAIALGPAIAGSILNLRLVLGGKVVRAVATGPSRAIYQGEAQR